jgi:hypothetical protein
MRRLVLAAGIATPPPPKVAETNETFAEINLK